MIAGLERFVAELRRAGIEVSPAEWLDALRAVLEVSLADRERFRRALGACLVKRERERPVFVEVFDRFFAAPARAGDGRGEPGAGSEGVRGRGRGAGAAPERRPPEVPPERRGTSPRPGAAARSAASLASRLDALARGSRTRRGRLRHVVTTPRAEHAERAAHRPDAARSRSVREHDLSRRLDSASESEIAAEVPRIVRRIRLSSGRRQRQSARGRVYLRRVFRDSLASDGVPFVLPRRRSRPRPVRVVLVIDVSWSVARAAGLFLSIAGEFVSRAARSRVIVFVDRACDATAEVGAWLARPGGESSRAAPSFTPRPTRPGAGIVRGGQSFAALVESLPGLDLRAPSDYGRSFHGVLRSRERPRGRNTVLLVLGDGRTNRFDPQAWVFEEIAGRAGAVIWLVPEAVERWGTGDSALCDYLPHVDVVVEAHDLAGLARGTAELVRRLGR